MLRAAPGASSTKKSRSTGASTSIFTLWPMPGSTRSCASGSTRASAREDTSIGDYEERKAALRAQVAGSDRDVQAVDAADKVVKARELRAEAMRSERSLREPALERRLVHYQQSLELLEDVAQDLPLVRQLAFELWALHHLPPRRVPVTTS